jgi:hypothetical protein
MKQLSEAVSFMATEREIEDAGQVCDRLHPVPTRTARDECVRAFAVAVRGLPCCGIGSCGSCGVPRPSLADYVAMTPPTDEAIRRRMPLMLPSLLDEARDPEQLGFDLDWIKGFSRPPLFTLGDQNPTDLRTGSCEACRGGSACGSPYISWRWARPPHHAPGHVRRGDHWFHA